MFPQRSRGYPPQSPYQMRANRYQQTNPYVGNPHHQVNQSYLGHPHMRPRNGLFRRATHGVGQGVQSHSYGVPTQYYQQSQTYFPQQQIAAQPYQPSGLQSLIRDEHGKVDFKKIGGGIQTAMGLANQVGPVIKMIGGFMK